MIQTQQNTEIYFISKPYQSHILISRSYFNNLLGTVHPLMIDDKMVDRFSFAKRDDPGPGRARKPATCGMGTHGLFITENYNYLR